MFFGQFRLAKTSIHSKNILKFWRFIHDQILIIKHIMKNMKTLDFGLFSNLKFSNKIEKNRKFLKIYELALSLQQICWSQNFSF